MIVMTLGTIYYPFQRAIDWLIILLECGVISEPVFLQYGTSDVSQLVGHPLVTLEPTVSSQQLIKLIADSRLVISHAGQGSTRMLATQGIPFILLPRLKYYGEHVDDHQLLFARAVEQYGIQTCLVIEEMKKAILQPPPVFQKQIFHEPKLTDHLLTLYPPEYQQLNLTKKPLQI